MSFKYGEFEGMRNGRYFTDMTEKSLDSLIGSINESAKCGIVCIKRSWMTRDAEERCVYFSKRRALMSGGFEKTKTGGV